MVLKERIINCFNSKAYTYEASVDIQPSVAEQLANRLPDTDPKTILEIGCGTGLFSQYLVQSFPTANVLLTDIAPAMIDVCRERFSSQANVAVACMDGESLTTQTPFDLIVSSMTLHWFTHMQKSLHHIIDALTPGGQFLFATLGQRSLREWRDVCNASQVSVPTPTFFSLDTIQQDFPAMKIQVEITKQFYPNAFAFLKTLQMIGAGAAQASHITFSPGMLRRIMNAFDEKYPDGVYISYEIIYGSYIKE